MSGFRAENMSSELSRFGFWLGEAYFWLFMIVATWAALSGAPWPMAFYFGAALTLGNVIARATEWRDMIRAYDTAMMVLNWCAIYAWQTMAMLITFIVARYLRRFVPEAVLFRPLDHWMPLVAVLFVLAILFGMGRIFEERAREKRDVAAEAARIAAIRKLPLLHTTPEPLGEVVQKPQSYGPPARIYDAPLSYETLYVGYSEAHRVRSKYDGILDFVDAALAESTPAKIAATEERLGVTLPEGLRRCYGVQNGGMVGWLYAPTADGLEEVCHTICPLENLYTLDNLGLNAPTTEYPDPSAVLAFWHDGEEMLLIDLRSGVVTFERSFYESPTWPLGDEGPTVRWSDWDAFFNSLRRGAV